MNAKDFIKKYEGWFSYVEREKLKQEMEADLQAYLKAKETETWNAAIDAAKFDELWDEHSEHIGSDLWELEQVAGSSVITKRNFNEMVKSILNLKK